MHATEVAVAIVIFRNLPLALRDQEDAAVSSWHRTSFLVERVRDFKSGIHRLQDRPGRKRAGIVVSALGFVERIALAPVVSAADVPHDPFRLRTVAAPRKERRDDVLKARHGLAIVGERRTREAVFRIPRHLQGDLVAQRIGTHRIERPVAPLTAARENCRQGRPRMRVVGDRTQPDGLRGVVAQELVDETAGSELEVGIGQCVRRARMDLKAGGNRAPGRRHALLVVGAVEEIALRPLRPAPPELTGVLRSAKRGAQLPWWSHTELLIIIGVLFGILATSIIWNRSIQAISSRRARRLAQEEIAHARTRLKVEERTELAVEIHDALSQTLTGIALQLEAALDIGRQAPERAERCLTTASQMLASCRHELRGCLWDLRTRTFEERDLTDSPSQTTAAALTSPPCRGRDNGIGTRPARRLTSTHRSRRSAALPQTSKPSKPPNAQTPRPFQISSQWATSPPWKTIAIRWSVTVPPASRRFHARARSRSFA